MGPLHLGRGLLCSSKPGSKAEVGMLPRLADLSGDEQSRRVAATQLHTHLLASLACTSAAGLFRVAQPLE